MMPANFPPIWILVLALPLAFSSLNSKAIGLAWVLLVLHGAWVAFQNRGRIGSACDYPWAKLWLLVSAAALSIKAIAVFYWSDPWGERHGEVRLFLGALALYALLSYHHLERRSLALLAHSLTISSAIGLMWVIIYGRGALPTHPIPWAGSMAMVSAFLLALTLKSDFPSTYKRIWFFGGLFSVMAVLTSQSRGAYGIVLWWLVVCIHHVWRVRKQQQNHRSLKPSSPRLLASVLVVLLSLAALCQTPVFQRPAQSLQDALDEIRVSSQSTAQGANSSVGARLYMWQNSVIAIEESPWIGHGHDTRKKLMQDWAESAQSEEVRSLGHVHNEFLHQWIDHGLLGLGSQIFLLVGLIVMAWKLHKKNQFTAAFSIGGISFIHMSSSLTNVNFAHNYYTASLSFFVVMSLWVSRLEIVDDRL